ncbi:hybrid sensor histidine kinase/response regulator transcription factor [Parabacteroides sp. ZJ-118]|uniref:hybrid sensor histidine kinase/response regulator transcription factor n=1 Tax=Parabacteroides sp. ZJ-118 TaxID=2709398 RepID=UPI001F151208|nr:hybrid sensor histidine kinase/response regulator transcription factor [Parabacteroides sp. ZJ-118]
MKTKALLLILILSFGLPASVRATEEIRFNHLGVKDGLPSNEITCILKDRKGFMWFGTTSGLTRFDGYEFTGYGPGGADSSFVEGGVSELAETADGKLWITYFDGGIRVYEPAADRFVPRAEILDSLRLESLPARVFTDREKRLYYTTRDNGFYRYDPSRGAVSRYPLDEAAGGVCGVGDVGDRLYVVHTSGRIQGIDKASGKSLFRDDYLTAYAKAQPFYMFADSAGELWLFLNPGHGDGVFRLDPGSGAWKHYTTSTPVALSSPMVRHVREDTEGNIWIATDHGGINLLDKRREEMRYLRNNPFDPTSLGQNSVVCLYRDDTGIMWAGTYKNGISYYHESIFKFRTVRYPLSRMSDASNNDYNCVVEDPSGDLWVGTSGNGLLRYNRQTGAYTCYRAGKESENGISGDVVISLAKDPGGNLWIGTYTGGLTRFDGKRFTHYRDVPGSRDGLSGNSVYSLYADARNRLWIGTLDGGLDRLELSTGRWSYYRAADKHDAIRSDIVYSLSGGPEGDILVGTSSGVNRIEPETGRVSGFDGTRDGSYRLKERIINVVFSDSRRLLWIGSHQGLHIYDPLKDRMYHLDQAAGLPDNSIMSILEDAYHTVWVGTKNGLLHITPIREAGNTYRFSWNSYDENEGVQGRVFNVNSAARLASGELAFGGTNGLTFVNPSRIRHNSYSPPAVITGLTVNNVPVKARGVYAGHRILEQDITYTNRLTLTYEERNFAFNISSCCYFLPLKNRYAFKMEGFDADWTTVDARRRRVTYTNLNPGTYTFQVKARNNDGVWSKAVTRLEITILPPFWATGWAIALYVITGVLSACGAMRFILRVQQRRLEREQERAIARKQHEVDEMKLRFFTNVSHEFRTPLTLILTPLEKLMKTEENAETRQILRLIHRNADRLLKLVNQLLDFRKIDARGGDTLVLSTGDIVPFVRDVAYSFKELSEQRQIRFSFSSVFTSLPMRFDTDKVFKIVSNLLSNAFKFTPEGGAITVTLSLAPDREGRDQLRIAVADSGIGIPADKQEAIFDRFYQVPSSDKGNPAMGTGIGLHLCREFARMHQGSVAVRSEPGAGSTFTVTLPLLPPDHPDIISSPDEGGGREGQAAPAGPAPEAADTEAARAAGSTLLVVDDNADFLEFMRLSLSGAYSVLTAADGEAAWKIIPEELPDMVISDVMMPVTDGIALCRRIKGDIRTSHIPVILLTAKSAEDNQLTGLEAGADDYIGKPFNMDMLLLKIRHLVEMRKRMQQSFMQSSARGIALTEVQAGSMDEALMRKAIAYIEEQIANPELSVERLSREMGMSRVNFYKKSLSITGKAPVELIRTVRLKRAAQLLEKSQMRVNEVAVECGFNDVKLFRKYFKDEFGRLPSDYHK